MDLSKETHPGKPYSIHIKECNELVSRLMREIYNYPEDMIIFAFSFSELHDVGKLLPEWSLNRDKRPHHAIEGAEWFLREGMDIYIGSLHPGILAYAILTHHSPLYVPREVEKRIDDAEKEKLRHFNKYSKCRALIGLGPNSINNLIRGTKKHVRFDLADVIGIVKLADIISAKNIPLNDVLVQYYWPENLEEKLISGV
ncbi:MAG: hypothetical protein LM601_11710, partial [Candidatus Verstraetearchaeota archaeon]|nr:hypothetical protein [Candidatus Verstraetearchaeota archaeon]